jgi:hypothetical protein
LLVKQCISLVDFWCDKARHYPPNILQELEYPTILLTTITETSAAIEHKKEKVGSCRMLRRTPRCNKLHYIGEVEEFVKGEDHADIYSI